MDPLILTILLRSVERLLVVVAGALSIYLGYRLFLAMPSRERGEGKLNLPGGISIYLSRVGPGVFFSLFGAIVLALSFHYAISFTDPAPLRAAASVSADAAAAVPASAQVVADSGVARQWSGAAPASAPQTGGATEAERVAALVAIERLNKVPGALAADIDPWVRDDIDRAVRVAKLRLMEAVWDEGQWGPLADFRTWLNKGEPVPAPDNIRSAVGHYQAGLAPEH